MRRQMRTRQWIIAPPAENLICVCFLCQTMCLFLYRMIPVCRRFIAFHTTSCDHRPYLHICAAEQSLAVAPLHAPYIGFLSQSVQSHVGRLRVLLTSSCLRYMMHKTMHRLCYTCMTQHVCKIVLCIVWRRRLPFQVVYTMHNTSRESRKVVAACWSQSLRGMMCTFFSSVFLPLPLFVFAIVLIISVSAISFFVLLSRSFGECSTALCSLQGFFICLLLLVALLKNTYSRGIVTDGHHNISIRLIKTKLFYTLHCISNTEVIHYLIVMVYERMVSLHSLWLIIVDFLEVWNPHVVQVCNTILLYVVIIRTALGEVRVNDFGDD
jgi:hypothetical protein